MSSSTSSNEPLIEVGRVGRPHGLDGSFHVTRPLGRLLVLGGSVLVGGAPCEIERRVGTEDRPVLRLRGHSGREAAEALRGSTLAVRAADVPPLEEGEYWAHELEGCAVADGARELGVVRAMLPLPSCEVLEVVPPGGGPPFLVPLVRDAVRSVDVASRRIDVDAAFLGM